MVNESYSDDKPTQLVNIMCNENNNPYGHIKDDALYATSTKKLQNQKNCNKFNSPSKTLHPKICEDITNKSNLTAVIEVIKYNGKDSNKIKKSWDAFRHFVELT